MLLVVIEEEVAEKKTLQIILSEKLQKNNHNSNKNVRERV